MSRKEVFETADAPTFDAPFGQATAGGGLAFTAGQAAITPDGDLLVDESVAVQTRQALDNVVAVLDAAGATPADVLKVTVFLADIESYEEMNGVYEEYFDDEPPARTALEVANLPFGADVEIEAVAALDD